MEDDGKMWKHLEASGGSYLAACGGIWRHLGDIWETSGRHLGGFWGPSGRHLGASGKHLGGSGGGLWASGAPEGSWKQKVIPLSAKMQF